MLRKSIQFWMGYYRYQISTYLG